MNEDLIFEFAAPVLRNEDRFVKHYIPVPDDIADQFFGADVRRVIASFKAYDISRSIHGRRQSERYILLGNAILKNAGVHQGENLIVTLRPDPEPNVVHVCEELEEALAQDDAARERFDGMTPGKRRGLTDYVCSGKREETRVKRAVEICRKLRTYTLYGDR